jgi:hypothetical protein
MTTLALFAILLLRALQPPQNQAAAQPPTAGTATIRGHVFAADSGSPLRRAQVRIVANEIRENRVTTTDEQGGYEFTEVRPGRYTISASKGSFVTASYGQQRTADVAKPLQILDRQTVERLDLSLSRGGIIAGRVVDDLGEPLSDVNVIVQRYQFVQGQRRLLPAGGASTNDLGEFRVFGVAPGQYYLLATWRNSVVIVNPDAPVSSPLDRITYPATFYPGTPDAATAQRLAVSAAREITDLVMVLRMTKAARVTGTAQGADGKPMSSGMVMVTRTADFNIAGNAPVRPDGTFTINGLAPGEYSLRIMRPGGPGEGPETATAKVSVNGEDVADVHVVAAKPTSVTGQLIVDPAAAAQLPRTISLPLFPANFEGGLSAPPPPPVRVNDDYTFELKSTPGRMRVSLGGFGPPPLGWMIKAVRVNNTDVTDSGIEFKPNEDITGVEIELTNKTTTVGGLVTNGGDPVKEYTVIVFAQEKEKWNGNSRYIAIGRPDQDGRFKTSSLPPGDYNAVAVDRVDPGQWTDPEFLESVRPRASMFSLMEGETKTLDLKLTTLTGLP